MTTGTGGDRAGGAYPSNHARVQAFFRAWTGAADAARAALRAAVPGGAVDDRLTVGGAPVPLPVPQDAELDPAVGATLQAEIDGLVAAAPITFRPDSPELTPAGARTVERIVALPVKRPAGSPAAMARCRRQRRPQNR